MNYYIADLHLGHANIIRLCNRPFITVDEMDNTIIDNWNQRVKDSDTVYILGDFAFKGFSNPVDILHKLNGHKVLIEGNHDGKNLRNPEFRKCFDSIKNIMTIFDTDTKLILCHYPMVEWDGYFHGVLHLYGHIHNNTGNKAYKIMSQEPNAFNVGAEILEYVPRTLSEVKKLNRQFVLSQNKEG